MYVLLLSVLAVTMGLLVDFSSARLPWLVRRVVPPLCYGAGIGLLLIYVLHVAGLLHK